MCFFTRFDLTLRMSFKSSQKNVLDIERDFIVHPVTVQRFTWITVKTAVKYGTWPQLSISACTELKKKQKTEKHS